MEEVWIELGKTGRAADLQEYAPHDRTAIYPWQALFACQVWLRDFGTREKYKWGFNLGSLLEDAWDRQREFIEAQHPAEIRFQQENPERRSLALRVMNIPGTKGLLLSLVGRIAGPNADLTRQKTREYAQEVLTTFPYDYELCPATTQAQFRRFAGWEILQACQGVNSCVHVRRFESVYSCENENLYLLGNWRTSLRSDEVIWRALAGIPSPVMMNITLQPVLLLERERAQLHTQADIATRISQSEKAPAYQPYISWATSTLQRRAAQVVRSYALQVHFACPAGVPEYLPRVFGTAVTRDPAAKGDQSAYSIIYPMDENDVQNWKPTIYWLDMLPVRPLGPISGRLLDFADIDEARAVFRLPFTPQQDFPGTQFLDPAALNHADDVPANHSE